MCWLLWCRSCRLWACSIWFGSYIDARSLYSDLTDVTSHVTRQVRLQGVQTAVRTLWSAAIKSAGAPRNAARFILKLPLCSDCRTDFFSIYIYSFIYTNVLCRQPPSFAVKTVPLASPTHRGGTCQLVSGTERVQRPHQSSILGHFVDGLLQSITCSDTDNSLLSTEQPRENATTKSRRKKQTLALAKHTHTYLQSKERLSKFKQT